MYDADATPFDPSELPAPDGGGPRAIDPLRMLDQLAEAGLQIALDIASRVKDAEPAAPLADLVAAGLAYDRVSRAVRLCILLQDQLTRGRREREEAGLKAPVLRRKAHADRAVAIVKRIARDHCQREGWEVSAIVKETAERLDTDDIYGLVETRPIGELVALICRDFGLDPDWAALAQEAWAIEEAESGVGLMSAGQSFARPPPLARGEAIAEGDWPNDREALERAFRCDTG